jgi:uncharacterized protein (DUF1778 family)
VTCSSTCRGIQFRANKEPVVPVKLTFSIHQFEVVKKAADAVGKTINDYILNRLVKIEPAQ